jgi:hypothetical protein
MPRTTPHAPLRTPYKPVHPLTGGSQWHRQVDPAQAHPGRARAELRRGEAPWAAADGPLHAAPRRPTRPRQVGPRLLPRHVSRCASGARVPWLAAARAAHAAAHRTRGPLACSGRPTPLGPRGEPPPPGCRREAAAVHWGSPKVADSTAVDRPGLGPRTVGTGRGGSGGGTRARGTCGRRGRRRFWQQLRPGPVLLRGVR